MKPAKTAINLFMRKSAEKTLINSVIKSQKTNSGRNCNFHKKTFLKGSGVRISVFLAKLMNELIYFDNLSFPLLVDSHLNIASKHSLTKVNEKTFFNFLHFLTFFKIPLETVIFATKLF